MENAVCIIEVDHNLVFIKRSASMPSHRDQVGFFGGKVMTAESAKNASLREFQEESGILSSSLTFIRELPFIKSSKGKTIKPFYYQFKGSLEDLFKTAESNGEWTDLFSVSLKYLKSSDNWTHATMGTHSQVWFCTILLQDYCSKASETDPYVLWGASAGIVRSLLFAD